MIPNTHYDDPLYSYSLFDKSYKYSFISDLGSRSYSMLNSSESKYNINKNDGTNTMYQHLLIDSNNDICDIDLIPIFSQCMDDEI